MEHKQINYTPLSSRVGFKDYVNYDSKEALPPLMVTGFLICLLGGLFFLLPALIAGESPAVGLIGCGFGFLLLAGGVIQYLFRIRMGILFKRFADANGLEYRATHNPDEKGSIFQIGRERHSEGVISGRYAGRTFWFGTHFYTIKAGKYDQTIGTAVINIELPRAVPHVIIDGRQNRLPLGGEFDRSQRIELEGDFGKYFTVYCPKDYGRDVLYFLTPELMQALVDLNDKFDIEMLDHELYLYSRSILKPSELQLSEIFTIIEKLGGEVVENTERYQDWRVAKGLDVVAPSGMRLKRSFWPGLVAMIVFIAYVISIFVN